MALPAWMYRDPADCIDRMRLKNERDAAYKATKRIGKARRIKSLVKAARNGLLKGRG